jgi:TonB family protein
MGEGAAGAREFLRRNRAALGSGAVLAVLVALGVRWVVGQGRQPPPRRVMQFTLVTTQPPPRPPPPPPVTPPKVEESPATRVDIRPSDLLPDAPPPQSPPAGPLALAAEGEGPGDAFNLAGNPGGRSLLSGGGLGDGSGAGLGGGTGSRFGWYYARIAGEIEEAFRRNQAVSAASTRVELRIWADQDGRISRVQLVRSTGNPKFDEAIQSIVGLRLREPPPPDIPMPMIARLTARRPG